MDGWKWNVKKNTPGNKEDKDDYSLCDYIITAIYTSENSFKNSIPQFSVTKLITQINYFYVEHYKAKEEYKNKLERQKEEEKKREEEEKKRKEEEEEEKEQELQRQNDYLQRIAGMAIKLMIVKVEKKYFVSDYFTAGKPIGGVYVFENDDEFNKLTIPQTPSKSTETYKVYLDDEKNTIAVDIVWKSYEINKGVWTKFINDQQKKKKTFTQLCQN